MDLMLAEKVALVTAASRGLGRAAALALSEEGARLAISSRSDEILDTATAIQKQTGCPVLGMKSDLTRQAEIDALVQLTLETYGHIDILIINAGGPPPGAFLDLKPEAWEQAFRLTVMSAVHLCYAVVPVMLKQGSGSIVATQSLSVKQPIAQLALSNSLRMAVIGLMKTLADELGPQGIRVNSINPGWTQTDRVAQLLANRAHLKGTTALEEEQQITAGIPLGRMGSVEEFGRTIAWLASPAAAYIHGHALMFDGGSTRSSL
ncbi:MAG: SDR family oxidoreductase [Anaerolineales bacterium]|nr:SDR family oxidoreductase [Anaerolineales bacterium]